MRLPAFAEITRNKRVRCCVAALPCLVLMIGIPKRLPAQTPSKADTPQPPAQPPTKSGASKDSKATPDKTPDKKAQEPGAGPAAEEDHSPPAVTGGTPTITDTATLSPPGWLECDPGSLKNLNRDRILGTPVLFKLTSGNRRVQYRIATDGYIREGDGADGFGDTYLGLHYLFAAQERAGFDVAGRFTLTVPTARPALGGTRKFDYTGLFEVGFSW